MSLNKNKKMNNYLLLGIVFGVLAGISTVVSGVLLTLGYKEITRLDEVFSLSIVPKISVFVNQTTDVEPIQKIKVRNESNHKLVKVKAYYNFYLFSEGKIKMRHTGSDPSFPDKIVLVAERLQSSETKELLAENFTSVPSLFASSQTNGKIEGEAKFNALSLVLVYQREMDGKTFVHVEPFHLVISTDKTHFKLGSLYDVATAPPEYMIEEIKQIQEVENVYYRQRFER